MNKKMIKEEEKSTQINLQKFEILSSSYEMLTRHGEEFSIMERRNLRVNENKKKNQKSTTLSTTTTTTTKKMKKKNKSLRTS